MNWAVPWSTAETVDFIFLVVATIIIAAIPIIYGFRANLHDPLARGVLAGTGATATAFTISVIFTVAIHAGWSPPDKTVHWIARGLYTTVALGKAVLLLALLRVLRTVSRNRGSA